jgi:hypothetical protein
MSNNCKIYKYEDISIKLEDLMLDRRLVGSHGT